VSADQQAAPADRQAEVIARAVFQHAANATGDIDTMRAAALALHNAYDHTAPGTIQESPR
jgi:hypothetical protein